MLFSPCGSPTGFGCNIHEEQSNNCMATSSGTEDADRVYVEATTQGDANILTSEAAALFYNLCDGVDELPSFVKGDKL